jgi:subtilisin family serine protease
MKNAYQFIVVTQIFVLLLSSPVLAEQPSWLFSGNADIPVMYNQGDQDKVVMLGFKDAGINRIRSNVQYRNRGSYHSTAWSRRRASQLAEKYGLTELTAWPVTELGIHCIVYKLPDSMSMQQALQKMARDESLDLVQEMHFYHTRAQRYSDPYYKLQFQVQKMHIEQLHAHATGKNITIALIDTGVDLNHPDLQGQISENHNYASVVSPEFINDLHGTAVAGVMVASAGNATGIVGIAPDSRIMALKSCWPLKKGGIEAVCNSFTLALAINKAIEANVDVLNLSLTGRYDPLLEQLITKAIDKGIVVVAAVDESELGKDTNLSGNFPASMTRVIGVNTMMSDSGTASKGQTVNAPGDEILTTFPNASYDFISGSSFSTAHISGIIALLLEKNSDLEVDDLLKLLTTTKISDLHLLFES